MNVSVETIYNFHRVRTACHVASVNYFAGLLGYHFPEHDNDKNIEPIRTGYAYKNYAKYHKNYNILPAYEGIFTTAHATHHAHASHHLEFYGGDVSHVSRVCLIEMICDWFSANFEQIYILGDIEYSCVSTWFDATMAHLNWTPQQLKMIRETIEFLGRVADKSELMRMWAPALELAEI